MGSALTLADARPPAQNRRHAAAVLAAALQPHELAALQMFQQTGRPQRSICLAKVAEAAAGCGRGLVAAQHLQPGQPVLTLPVHNTLSVPLPGSSSVYQWECEWLEPFERAHGPLPLQLVDFLMTADPPALSAISE